MTSPDGITWTAQVSAADNAWGCVCWGNGLFVAVAYTGTGNRVMTSPDGITWTTRVSAADNAWRFVTYGNGLFVAVAFTGTGNRVMTSPDGITWTTRVSAADNAWVCVCWGNGLFVAVASDGTSNGVMTSPDGITWTARTPATVKLWVGVAYSPTLGLFASVASESSGVMTSTYMLYNWGKIWKAIKFNGVTGNLKKTSSVLTAGDKSIEFITQIYSYGESVSGLFLYAKLADGTHYCYGSLTSLVTGGGVRFKNNDSATAAQSANTSILLSTWYHIFITRTSLGVINIYINGVLSGTADQAAGTIQSTTDFYIGNNQADSLTMDGTLEHYGITTDIKAATFIADRYNMLFNNSLFFGDSFVPKVSNSVSTKRLSKLKFAYCYSF
jgi:hypothetical protein